MRLLHTQRWEVGSRTRLHALAQGAPVGAPSRDAARSFHRDIYFDTADGTLRRRGILCRFRIGADDRRRLTLDIAAPDGSRIRRHGARVRELDPREALGGRNEVARRLRGIVDPALLSPTIELEVERLTRRVPGAWPWGARLEAHFETVTVRKGELSRAFHQVCAHAGSPASPELARLAAAFAADGVHPTSMSRLERAELLLKWMPAAMAAGAPALAIGPAQADDDLALDPELSFLASQARVLELADDASTPLAERLRFVAIVAANLDEFFAVRVAGLKLSAPEQTEESSTREILPDIAIAAARLMHEQQRIAAHLVSVAGGAGVQLRRWEELTQDEVAHLRRLYDEELHAGLTPFAMTLSPGHPIPNLAALTLSVAVLLRDPRTGARHLAQVDLPHGMPRFVPVAEDGSTTCGVVLAEEIVRRHLDHLYPERIVEEARCFRVTRGGELALDEERVDDLLSAVDEATRRRLHNGIVRVELEARTSPVLRELLVEELQRASGGTPLRFGPEDVYDVDGMLDLRALTELPLPADPELRYLPFTPRDPASGTERLFDRLRAGDLLVHHPFESFDGSVVRFLREAADDPDVTAVKITLYRVGERSPIIDALRDAAVAGKQVHAFVELRARFDEERNVKWVRALEQAGAHVVYGLVGVKTHAKAALVVRREAGRLRRYVHVGTGNYNPQSGRAYTDLSLFTADDALCADVADLFNALTGSTRPDVAGRRGALVAPAQLLPSLLERISREAGHARAGRTAGIRIKVNGLSDPEIIGALLSAARQGVRVELVVRGICTLRPGVPGRSEGIRIVANAGRFLEHSRIYHFANGGEPEWLIGSADLRPRNLRRRVELLVPVRDPGHQVMLQALMDEYLGDPRGWELEPSGRYRRQESREPGAQERLLREIAGQAGPNVMRARTLSGTPLVDFTNGAD